MPNSSDDLREIRSHGEPVSGSQAHRPATRTVINVLLAPEVETNADVMACAVEAIHALPYVADVTSRKGSRASRSYPTGADTMSAERRPGPDARSITGASARTTSTGHDQPGPATEQRDWWHVLLRLLGAVALAGLVFGALASGILLLILR